MSRLQDYFDACKEILFQDPFDAEEERCYFILKKGELPKFSEETCVFVTSYKSLWNSLNKVASIDPPAKRNEKGYQKVLMEKALSFEVFPILLSTETFMVTKLMESLKEKSPESTSNGKVEPKKEPATKKESSLPKVALVHIPKRKAWPYSLMGDTKSIRTYLKFSDRGEKVSAYVTNVNKEFGPGWNLKEEVIEDIREQDGKTLDLVEYDSPEKYKTSLE